MSKETKQNNIEVLKTLHGEIQDKWSEINKTSPSENKDFWSEISTLRMMLKDFFQAFGTIDKREKVNHWNLLNDISLISVLIEG